MLYMKKVLLILSFAFMVFVALPQSTFAVDSMSFYDLTKNGITPVPCGTIESRSCPKEMNPIYEKLGEPCAASFSEFSTSPTTRHFWIEDPAVTAQGKANERARQFIYWAVNNRAVDDHPVLKEIWSTTSSVAFFFVVIVAALFGLGMIVSRRTNFNLNLAVWPTLIRIGLMMLYIALSASIVLLLIQLSEILMRFFIDNLGGKDLFNIYFTNSGSGGALGNSERNYTDFIGCRDLNLRVQESIDTKFFLYKLTNITYYMMGVMIILRKVLLWFMLFVAPFLALLMPFVFIRNIGWIWIGVFFQWLMYGPLFALFLGALSRVWKAGIPFTFDFSRVVSSDKFAAATNPLIGYTYPTAMNILYGGPAQINARQLSALNSGSYVDTFTEYIITLIMLWAVTFFPWWLLRIFRDYCCDGIYAMKNVLFAMYDEMRGGGKSPTGPKPTFDLKQVLKVPTKVEIDTKNTIKISSREQIQKASTADLSRTLDIRVSKLTDIARMEANQTRASAVQKNLAFLANPVKATTSAERQQFMNMRTELFNRAIKEDGVARTLLSSTSTSSTEREKVRTELVKDISKTVVNASSAAPVSLSKDAVASIASAANMSADKTQEVLKAYAKTTTMSMSQAVSQLAKQMNVSADQVRTVIENALAKQTQKTAQIMTTYMDRLAANNKVVASIASHSALSSQQVRDIMTAYTRSMDKPANQVISLVSKVTNIAPQEVKGVMQQMGSLFYTRNLILDFAEDNNLPAETVEQAVATVAKAAEETVGTPQGSAPQPDQERVATAVAEQAMTDETIRQQANVIEKQITEDKPAVVRKVIQVVAENSAVAHDMVQEVAKAENVQEEEAAHIVQEQLEVTTKPEENIEKLVAVPPSVSLEEYEELKDMWEHQYEEGEIPVTENIRSRDEWVEQDVVTITNVMNKILSPNQDLQQQGLDELGFIIPIFMINNLKGEQLITYLKAKLEAAKATRKLLDKEKQVREKVEKEKENDEELVELKPEKKAEEPKLMHLDDEEQEKGKTIEDIGNTDFTQAPAEVNPAYMEKPEEVAAPESSGETPSAEKEMPWDQEGMETEEETTKPELKEYGEEETNVMNKLKEYGEDEPKLKEFGEEEKS